MKAPLQFQSYTKEYRNTSAGNKLHKIMGIFIISITFLLGTLLVFDLRRLYIKEYASGDIGKILYTEASSYNPTSSKDLYDYNDGETASHLPTTTYPVDTLIASPTIESVFDIPPLRLKRQANLQKLVSSHNNVEKPLHHSPETYNSEYLDTLKNAGSTMLHQSIVDIIDEVRILRNKRALVVNLTLSNLNTVLVDDMGQSKVHTVLSDFKVHKYGSRDEKGFRNASKAQVEMLGHLFLNINNYIMKDKIEVSSENIKLGSQKITIISSDDHFIDLIVSSIYPSRRQPKNIDEMIKHPFFTGESLGNRLWQRSDDQQSIASRYN